MKRQNLGFTLIELIVTLALAAILLTVGVPAFQEMIRNNRAATHANEFMSTLNFARSEAVKRGRRVVLCKSQDGASCTTDGTWDQGWIVFVDTDNDAAVDAGENIIRIFGALSGGNTLQGSTDVADYISYSPDGIARLTSGTSLATNTQLTFGLCVSGKKNAIEISQTGRARVDKITCP